jgi:hypothetical protein
MLHQADARHFLHQPVLRKQVQPRRCAGGSLKAVVGPHGDAAATEYQYTQQSDRAASTRRSWRTLVTPLRRPSDLPLQVAHDALSERLDVHAHRLFRPVGVMAADRLEYRLVLGLEVGVMVRCRERDEPEPQRSFVQLAQ